MSTFGDRMKSYERPWQPQLPPRMPIVVRVDGRAFHTLTRGCRKPFDERIQSAMDEAALALCREAGGAALAYVQSDEISVLIHPYKKLDSQAWFGGDVVKIASITACVAANAFNGTYGFGPAEFDSRVFVLPEADVCNYFLWRQRDAERNSISGYAQSMFSHKSLHGLSCDTLQNKMLTERGFNWNDAPTALKRGRCVRKMMLSDGIGDEVRTDWCVDNTIPIFSQDRAYIESLLAHEGGPP